MQIHPIQNVMRRRLLPGLAGAIAGLGLLATNLSVLGQTYTLPNLTVTTLGGGPLVQCGSPAGFEDGNTLQDSQFDEPYATALDSMGNLYIADTHNNAVRVVSQPADTATSDTSTLVLDLVSITTTASGKVTYVTNNAAAGVIGVAEDSGDDLYVLDATNGVLTKWNSFFNLLEVVAFNDTLSANPPVAAAMAVSHDSGTNIFVAFTNGIIVRFNLTNAAVPAPVDIAGITLGGTRTVSGYPAIHYVVASFNWKPSGLTLMPNGQLAVSDTLSNAIYLVSTNDYQVPQLYAGGNSNGFTTNTAGYTDGPPGYAQFNQPHGLSASSGGQIIVADTMNNAVRLIDTNLVTSTLYGARTNFWPALCCSCDPAVYPGWMDGSVGNTSSNAESGRPVSVTISSNGVVFVTELQYDVLREITGTSFNPVFFTNQLSLLAPGISITNPISSSYFTSNETVTLEVTVSDPNAGGTITNVEYFVNGVNLATVTNSPFTFMWNNPPLGTNIITAEVFDNYGLTTVSAPVTIYVLQPQPPSVAITSPTNNSVVFNPTNLTVTVVATDPNPNGAVETITLYDNMTTLIGQQNVVSNAPVSFLWINPTPPGPNVLNAVALDNLGLSVTSAPVTVTVTGLPPTAAPPPAPVISPNSGYFPFCETIAVTETASNQPIELFYTTDGTTPTTNSIPVGNLSSNNGVFTGSIEWCDSLHDLRNLQVLAFNGVAFSATASGQAAPTNEIGFVRGVTNGPGSTVVLPVVVDLTSNGVLASIQFRVEITSTNSTTPGISSMKVLDTTTNDFVPLVGPGTGNTPAVFETVSYPVTNNGQGLLISAAGGGTGFSVNNFAALCLLAVQIPSNAVAGQTYQLSVLVPSGTSDAQQTPVSMVALTNQTLTVSPVQYFVGDSSPGRGYNPGEFGNGILDAADVNNAVYASVGIRVPFPFSDAYDAMDVYPETATELGDKFITYLDWQHILLRSEGLETNNWVRFWSNGIRNHVPITWIPGGPAVPIGVPPGAAAPMLADDDTPHPNDVTNPPPGLVWFRQALIGAGTLANLLPGNSYSIPVYEKTAPGYSLGGLQFRATLSADGGAPAPGAISFSVAPGVPDNAQLPGMTASDVVCAWNIGVFSPAALQGSNLLGSINFQVPAAAQPGQSYSLRFSGVDGAKDLDTEYQMESVPGTAWVLSSPQQPPQITSDEWRTNFFGSYSSAAAADSADPDGDGSLNWQEYIAGTNPTNALSRLQFSSITVGAAPASGVTLSWLTAPGKTYLLQSTPNLGGPNWSVIRTNIGDGNLSEFSAPNSLSGGNFYRVCVQP